jgi:hypothetical protein
VKIELYYQTLGGFSRRQLRGGYEIVPIRFAQFVSKAINPIHRATLLLPWVISRAARWSRA